MNDIKHNVLAVMTVKNKILEFETFFKNSFKLNLESHRLHRQRLVDNDYFYEL